MGHELDTSTAALLVAIESGIGAECAAQFLAQGADPLRESRRAPCALDMALALGDRDCLRAIFDSGALDGRLAEVELFAARARAHGDHTAAALAMERMIRSALAQTQAPSQPAPRL